MATSTQSIRDIVTTHASAAAVLQRFEISLCANSEKSLEQACASLQLSVEQVLDKINDAAAAEQGAAPADLATQSLQRVIQHIVRTHHQYVRRELPRLTAIAQKIASKHADRSPHMPQVATILDALRAEMFSHLEKEESILFPYIVQLEESPAEAACHARACFPSVVHPIRMMVREHDIAQGLVAEVRNLTSGFTPPDWACANQIAFHGALRLFEADLAQHVRTENDILFPRAIQLESESVLQ